MKDLKSMDIYELTSVIEELGEKKFRANQIFQAIHKNMVESIDQISSLSKIFREKLKENYYIKNTKIVKKLESKIDETKKYLLRLEDGNVIETVFMKYKHGNTICISTQVGCKMGCIFCASTKKGLIRNLTSGEILSQIYTIQKDTGEKITNIVLMGSGEPLDNFENVIKFFTIINNEKGQNISYRNITLSTCGIVDKIYELANFKKPINLAISLHNPFDIERRTIMPSANKYKLEDILKACKYYNEKTGRRISFEYTLILGENDSINYAKKLAELCSEINSHVNLIPLNEVKEYTKLKSKRESIKKFKNTLEKLGVNSTIRRELGSDINAACGQLRIDFLEKESD